MRTPPKSEVVRLVRSDCNSIKSQLIQQHARLVDAGAVRAAASLEKIIFDLEAWQAKN